MLPDFCPISITAQCIVQAVWSRKSTTQLRSRTKRSLRLVTIQVTCEGGEIGGLWTAPGIPEEARGSGWGLTALSDLAAWDKLHPETNGRLQDDWTKNISFVLLN